MYNNLKFLNIFTSMFAVFYVLFSISLREVVSQASTGQKAHFSLKDTPGSFNVHATAILAKVSSQADSVNVVVKPGIAKYPLLSTPTEKPLVHVMSPAIVRPQGGWNFYNFVGKKRSGIVHTKTDIPKKTKSFLERSENVLSSHISGSKRTHLKRSLPGFNIIDVRSRNLGGSARSSDRNPQSHNLNIKLRKKRYAVERKMILKGGTGSLKVNVSRNETKILSSTGGIDVFIKNPTTTSNAIE